MRLTAPLEPAPSAPLARAHPLPKLAAAVVLMLALFATVDLVTTSLISAALMASIPFTGLPFRALLPRLLPLVGAASGIALFNTLFGASHDPITGVALGIRLAGISLSGVLAVATTDPMDLADAVVEHLHASPRFVVGTLAAWRLAPLFGREWEITGLARRSRGLEAAAGPALLVSFPGRTFALLVGAIRRATQLALAMDARGFGRRRCRTLARPRPITRGDLLIVGMAVAVATAATAVSVSLGTWRPLISL